MADSESNNTITFQDTSEFIYRNTSEKRGGGSIDIGRVSNKTDLDVEGSEDIARVQDQLSPDDQIALRATLAELAACVDKEFCPDETELQVKAQFAWDRASTLYPDYKVQIDAELDDIRTDMLDEICLWENNWNRTAGSSLNCIVADMKTRAQTELARRMSGVIAERLIGFKQHETQAISQAFADNFTATMETKRVAFSQIGALYGILRGSTTSETTARDYDETREEDAVQTTLSGRFYYEASSTAANDGTYAGDADDAIALAKNLGIPAI